MTATVPTNARVTFGGVLRSEWVKLVTLRSTVWCYVILVVLTVGFGALVAALIGTTGDDEVLAPSTQEAAQATWLMVSTVGVGFGLAESVQCGGFRRSERLPGARRRRDGQRVRVETALPTRVTPSHGSSTWPPVASGRPEATSWPSLTEARKREERIFDGIGSFGLASGTAG